jgi:regulator of protease activity HflC (stomatin/prohibitin superfamily)
MTMRRLVLLLALTSVAGCTCHSTGANEVGVLTYKILPFGQKGVQPDSYPPGATYFFPAIITDWHTFETKLQNLRMMNKPDENGVIDDVEFKTVDGNDISVDLTVAWRINPEKAPEILQRVGESTSDVQERLVRPAARAYVRDSLNRLRSEDFYVADKRFAAAEEAKKTLSTALNPEGVIIEQVILGEHRFAPAYEEVIHEKKIAEQNGEKLKSEASAAGEGAKRNLESARGKVNQQIAGARGELAQARLAADAQLVKAKNDGEAILVEAKSRAQGIEKENAAMGGAGGKTMVKLKIAEALQGKRIVLVPGGKGGNLQTLDVNQLITAIAARKVTAKASTAQEP